MSENLSYYLNIDYPIILKALSEDYGGGWLAEHPDLKGCIADGETEEEALQNLKVAKELWIETALKRKITIPVPQNEDVEEYSGKFTLRMPKYLHKQLSNAAKEEGVSLNQYILSLVSFNEGQKISINNIIKAIQEKTPTINLTLDMSRKMKLPSHDIDNRLMDQWNRKSYTEWSGIR